MFKYRNNLNILLNLNILNNNGEDIKREKASNQNKRH